MAEWCCLGQAASIAQLTGVDASGLISMIVKAARTVRRNKEECRQLVRRAEKIDGLLRRLQDSEMVEHPETRYPLEELKETLRRACELVESCQRSVLAYRFCMGSLLADKFRAVQREMDDCLDYLMLLFQNITYDDHTRLLREILIAVSQEGAQVPADLGSVSHSHRNIASDDRGKVKGKLEKVQAAMGPLKVKKGHWGGPENTLDEVSTENQRWWWPFLWPCKKIGAAPKIDRLICNNGTGLGKFTFSHLADATNNFSLENRIGLGGFSTVYKGRSHDGHEIAVKRSRGARSTFQFENEIELIPKLQHRNIVKLLGYCIQKGERILVFEYMPNGSLDSYIYGRSSGGATMEWDTRSRIVKGVAQGALYLHELYGPRIIHGDLKPGNILLDSDMNAKICDFGISKTLKPGADVDCTGVVMGSRGFIAPEYVEAGCFSVKSDVYSFGAMLLQIISGKRGPPPTLPGESRDFGPLNGWAWDLWTEKKLMDFIDPSLRGEPDDRMAEIMRWIQIALLCVQRLPAERPSMWDVLLMLSCERDILREPHLPAYYTLEEIRHTNHMQTVTWRCPFHQSRAVSSHVTYMKFR